MKFFDKSKKSLQSKKPKRQPDPILKDNKKKPIEKLGSSQKKRLQKRIKSKFGKNQKPERKSKSAKKDETDDDVENDIEKNSDVEMDDVVNSSDNNDDINDEPTNSKALKLDDDDEDEENDFGIKMESDDDEDDDDDDVSMNDDNHDDDDNDDKESFIDDGNAEENEEEDKLVTNINVGEDVIKVTDLDSLNSRIKANMEILDDYKSFKSKNKSCHTRSFYVKQYLEDLCIKFTYNSFLINKFYEIFNKDLFKFLVASEEDRPITIRTNTLKTRRRQLKESLVDRDCNVESLQFSKVGMVVFSTKCAIGATSEYLAGHYILQGSSSMLPVMALAPKRGERILDLCAAPGGKTTHIAQIMANTGIIFANDVNKDRLKAVMCNLARMGVMNTVVICSDGRKIHKKVKNFDRVLCDAPCTGTGVISKDKNIKHSKSDEDLRALTLIQKQLICSAIDACKVGGYVVYSTCSVLVEENEQVVDYACRKRNVKIAETGLFGTKGFVNFCSKHFNQNMDRTRRYYPHENNMDGFFLAKLQKVGAINKTPVEEEKQ